MNLTEFELRTVPVDEMRPLIARARPKEEFLEMVESIREFGVIAPPQVIDRGRKGKDGVRYDIVGGGEGRWRAAQELGWREMPVLVVSATAAEAAGRFMTENEIRKRMPWAEKGRMVRAEMDAGSTLEEAAKAFHISPHLAKKYLRVISKTAQDAEEDVRAMGVNDAEVLTTIPARGQRIVIQVAAQRREPVREVAKAAKAAMDEGADWSKTELEKALKAKDRAIESRERKLEELRELYAFGPGNIRTLLRNPKILKACRAAKINVSRFLE